MKRIVLAAALLLAAGAAAQADTDHWTDLRPKLSRGDDVLSVDAQTCRDQTGQQNYNYSPMLPGYSRCMRARGWRFDYTARIRDYHQQWIVPGVTWTDPDRPGTCHYILGGAGSECSNY